MYISYPFSIDARGRVATAQTPRKVWLDRVRAVVSTQTGDRVMRPDFGLDSMSAVLNAGTPAGRDIESQIREAFSRHLPSLTPTRVRATEGATSNVTEVDLVFTSPDSVETTTNLSVLDGEITFNQTD